MAEDRDANDASIDARNSQGFLNRPSGPVYQHFGDVINEGASLAEIEDLLRSSGRLSLIATRLPEQVFLALLKLVAQIEIELEDVGEQIYVACSATLPASAQIPNTKVPARLLANLCEQPTIKAWPPLFECVERFARAEGIQAAQALELRRWTDDAASQVNPVVPAREIERLRQEISAAKSESADATFSWLQVYLEPDPLNRTHERKQPLYRVELVLRSAKTGPEGLVLPIATDLDASPAAAGRRTLDELPSLLDAVFGNRETLALIPQIRQLVIEIVAPSDVLLHGFERWKRNVPGGDETYGIFAPVVVRLRDRLAIPDAARQKLADECWRDKWHTFSSRLRDETCAVVPWINPNDLDAYALQDDANVVCLGLASPLMPGCREVFDALRDAGIPIALWMRGCDLGPAVPADWLQRMSRQLADKQLCKLREVIYLFRRLREVRTDASHFGNALTLLWDDPDRPPLKYESQGVYV
jgi:hypothetical protein